jgi:succinyl-CoA synthetase beta subunit
VRRVDHPGDLEAAVAGLEQMELDGRAPRAVLIEEWVPIERELFLAVAVDRDKGLPLVLCSDHGGVDVEHSLRRLQLPVDPWLMPKPHHIRSICDILRLPYDIASPWIDGLWSIFREMDALLVEVNPLGAVGNQLVALDARVVLDDNARHRRAYEMHGVPGTAFETACGAVGSSGVEMDGEVAIITSGAGLAMSSLDLLVSMGGRPRAIVDLGTVVFQDPEKIGRIIDAVRMLSPNVLLFNFYFQLARCDTIARGVVDALAHGPWTRVVFRMRGVGVEEARRILEGTGALLYEDLTEAVRAAVHTAGA